MLNVYKNYGKLSGVLKFNLAWNPLWFLLEVFAAITLHSAFALVFMVLFAAFWLVAIHFAKRELVYVARREQAEAEFQETYERIFGRKDDAA